VTKILDDPGEKRAERQGEKVGERRWNGFHALHPEGGAPNVKKYSDRQTIAPR
jgi:hypothetical protein